MAASNLRIIVIALCLGFAISGKFSPVVNSIRGKVQQRPVTINRENHDDNSWEYRHDTIAVYSIQGGRRYMEDRFSVETRDPFFGFAVYDGHGGSEMAQYAKDHMLDSILTALSGSHDKTGATHSELIAKTVLDVDNLAITGRHVGNSGSTAVLGVLWKNKEASKLYIANVGDSRAVTKLVNDKKNEALQSTADHKPQKFGELLRIHAAGAHVVQGHVIFDNEAIGVSRALGDEDYKKYGGGWMIADPGMFTIDLKERPVKFLILASDGLWDVFSNTEAVKFVAKLMKKSKLFGAKELAQEAIKRGSNDNITVMIVKIKNNAGV